jgi:hypothetical protein
MNKQIIGAQQARIHNIYKNIKPKILKTNAAEWFNKIYRTKHLTPKHIHIKVSKIEDGAGAPTRVIAIII